MKTRTTLLAAVLLLCAPGIAEASNRSVAAQRMTAQLFDEWGPESSSPSVTYKALEDPASGLLYETGVNEGGSAWQPAKLRVSCHGTHHCTGQLIVTAEVSPTREARRLCASTGGHFELEGNQGQYPGVTVSEVFVCVHGEQKEVIAAKVVTSEIYVALEDHATFRGRKGTYHETGWKEI
jgi:hypothetical protein